MHPVNTLACGSHFRQDYVRRQGLINLGVKKEFKYKLGSKVGQY